MKEKKPKQVHYVNNEDFCKSLVEYKEACKKATRLNKPQSNIPNYIGECFMKIAQGLSHKPNFINYTYRDEMISDGIENCLQYFNNFDVNKSKNPFAYFTQIIYFAFLRRIQKEKKELYVKYKSIEQFGILDDFEVEGEEGMLPQFEMYENIAEFIKNFEDGKKKKKDAKKGKDVDKDVDLLFN